jgi:hypothetical protein
MAHNYIYLIHIREFVNSGDNVYKIGKTKQFDLKRFKSYPNGSDLLFHCFCDNCDISERDIINMFDKKYIKRKEFGNEYYEGNYRSMIYDIFTIIDIENVGIGTPMEIDEAEHEIYFHDISTLSCDDPDIKRDKCPIEKKLDIFLKTNHHITFNKFLNNITILDSVTSPQDSIIPLINFELSKLKLLPIYCIKNVKNEFVTKVKFKNTWKTYYSSSTSQFTIKDIIDPFIIKFNIEINQRKIIQNFISSKTQYYDNSNLYKTQIDKEFKKWFKNKEFETSPIFIDDVHKEMNKLYIEDGDLWLNVQFK